MERGGIKYFLRMTILAGGTILRLFFVVIMLDVKHKRSYTRAYEQALPRSPRSDKTPLFGGTGAAFPTHKWILDTYAECIKTVRNPHERG